MIEATCAACGTLNRVPEANVPVGAKFITCADCKARVAITPAASKPAGPPAIPSIKPPPIAVPPPAQPTDVIDLADLPAPKRTSALGPAARRGALDPGELPAPRPRVSAAPTLDLDDLTGAPSDGGIDLPAPKSASGAIKRPSSIELASQSQSREPVVDLPAPKPRAMADLPAPKVAAGKKTVSDLPAPKAGLADLPAPKRGPIIPDLPAPPPSQARATEMPGPGGFFEDLPQPGASAGAELLAPKGFFDDLPQPAAAKPLGGADVPAPKGFFDDLPDRAHTAKPEVPAPKGFFDDLPGRTHTAKPEVPAPKGFFDDLPDRAHTARPEVPAPKGFFDDLPGRARRPTETPAAKGFFDDLPGPPARQAADALQLEDGPELDLIAPPAPPHDAPGTFDELDLSPPTAAAPPAEPPPVARFQSQPLPAAMPAMARVPSLDLEPDDAMARRPAAMPAPLKVPTTRPMPVAADAGAPASRKKLLVGALAAVVLAGGGAFFYQRHAAAVARANEIAEQLQHARTAYAAADAKHWQRAAVAARAVIELDPRNAEALGIGAESSLASALADGTGAPGKIAQARQMIDTANTAGITGPQLARARALSAIAAHQPEPAIQQLEALHKQQAKDPAIALYLGWALAARGDQAHAAEAYGDAIDGPATKIAALYGRGTARLELADLEGARADFTAVLALDKDHIGAQVGLAAAAPPSAAEQEESDLLAILARKDLGTADPRAVAMAWTRAGDAARRAGRYDVARDRYKKALATVPQDLTATTGLAETELRDGKVAAAAELIGPALAVAKDNVAAQLVQSEIEVADKKLPLARQRLAAIASHPTPLAPLEQARLYLVTGKLLEAEGKDDDAIDAYVEGAHAAKDLDLAPMMAAVDKLSTMIGAADAAKDAARADTLRGRSDQLLGELADAAAKDPRLALQLGLAYLQSGNPEKAEPWLRKASDARPKDAEAKFQLGRDLLKLGKNDDALAALTAALAADPERADIGIALARAYEALARDADAAALYGKLLAGKEPSLELRARAGRFFARTGKLDKAGEQGAKIVALDPGNAAGLYLKGEGLLAAGKAADAKQAFQRAVEVDRDPQYLDALGRAAEALAITSNDRELQDLALRSYLAATELAPGLFSSLAGEGRLYVARHEAAKAVPPLLAANKIDPRNAEVMALIGAAYQELQQATAALEWLEASARLAPSADTYWRIGQLYRDANQGSAAAGALASATRLAAEAEKKTGKPVAWLTDALYLRGRVSFDLHDEAGARDAWSLYVARNPAPSAQLSEVKQLLATSLRR
ncbi:MAG TPA: tetratricopeptide repeat protein [Kofleriaceae bacterium]|nr:tetratricopeptide repeat protein [Kofleriaceae bacterium]